MNKISSAGEAPPEKMQKKPFKEDTEEEPQSEPFKKPFSFAMRSEETATD